MTEKQLRAKIKDCMKTDKAFIEKLIDKAIASKCMDIDGAENNYLLAKNVLTAVYREMSRQYMPMNGDRKQNKNVENIFRHL